METISVRVLAMLLVIVLLLSGCKARQEDAEVTGKTGNANIQHAGASKELAEADPEFMVDNSNLSEELPQPTEQEVPEEEAIAVTPLDEEVETAVDDRKLIALTFDDGPGKYTDKLMDILAKNDAKATFFLIGVHISGYDDTLKRMRDEGHQIATHTQGHKNLTKLSLADAEKEMDDNIDIIYDITGVKPTAMRPPFGACNDTVKSLAKDREQTIVMWNVDTEDWKSKDSTKVSKAIMDGAADGAIILLHDFYAESVNSVEQTIESLIADGYTLVTVDELLARNGEVPSVGSVYYNMPLIESTKTPEE